MDNFHNDDFYQDSAPLGWTEKDWYAYMKKAEREISRFASLYAVNRLKGYTLEDIARLAGWPVPEETQEYYDGGEDDAEFSNEPWTLLNHPIFIITRALLKCLKDYLSRVIDETRPPADVVWNLARAIGDIESSTTVAANSTDLGEDLLAKCGYKATLVKINDLIAKISTLPQPQSEQGMERMRRINGAIFDLRELCLDLAEAQKLGKK